MTQAPTYLDFYKTFHHKAYKDGVTEVYSNFTARHGNHSNVGGNYCMVAGLQACIKKIIVEEWANFFDAPSAEEAVSLYEKVVSHGLGRPETAQHLRDLWELGYLPLEFRGLKEGSEVPYGIPHFTIKSTVPGFGWLTNMLETVISAEVWPVHTSLTTAVAYRRTFEKYAKETGFPLEAVPFQGHDFSFRGMMGVEAAKLSGMGHLMSGLVGSDTIPAAIALHNYYNADLSPDNPCATIASVDATEHSVQCSFQQDDEAYIDHCMDTASPEGILSIVSDGYDFWKLVTEFIPARKDKIMARNGKVVIRPDSGDPVKILTGYNAGEYYFEPTSSTYHDKVTDQMIGEVEIKGLVEYLYEVFGGTETETGHKLLDEHIGCIYGDSITLERQEQILSRLKDKGFCSGNVVLGIGSYTYQYVTRDTHGSAVKATSIVTEEDGRIAIFKDPKTGDSTKKSAKGLLMVVNHPEIGYDLVDDVTEEEEQSGFNQLELVWKDGNFYREQSLEDIRKVVAEQL